MCAREFKLPYATRQCAHAHPTLYVYGQCPRRCQPTRQCVLYRRAWRLREDILAVSGVGPCACIQRQRGARGGVERYRRLLFWPETLCMWNRKMRLHDRNANVSHARVSSYCQLHTYSQPLTAVLHKTSTHRPVGADYGCARSTSDTLLPLEDL